MNSITVSYEDITFTVEATTGDHVNSHGKREVVSLEAYTTTVNVPTWNTACASELIDLAIDALDAEGEFYFPMWRIERINDCDKQGYRNF